MTYGVSEGDRTVCAHCSDCEEFANVRGWTEHKTWELAAEHVRETGHGVMMHWRLYLAPLGTFGPDAISDWEKELLRNEDHRHPG